MARAKPQAPYTPPAWNYQGTELHRPRGIPESRMAAFDLPSRVGGWLHYPDGRVEAFPVQPWKAPAPPTAGL